MVSWCTTWNCSKALVAISTACSFVRAVVTSKGPSNWAQDLSGAVPPHSELKMVNSQKLVTLKPIATQFCQGWDMISIHHLLHQIWRETGHHMPNMTFPRSFMEFLNMSVENTESCGTIQSTGWEPAHYNINIMDRNHKLTLRLVGI